MSDRKIHWRCFHCGEAFTKLQERWAREHFGRDEGELPVCQMRLPGEHHLLTALRNAQDELARHRSEDTDLMRAIYAMQADHAQALRREEERGYEKGVADGRRYPAENSADSPAEGRASAAALDAPLPSVSAPPAGEVREKVARIACDTFTNGNAQLEEVPGHHRELWYQVADAILASLPLAGVGEITDAQGIAWFESRFGVPIGDVPGRLDVERMKAARSQPSGEASAGAEVVVAGVGEEREACAQVAESFRLAENLLRQSMLAEMNHVEWNARVCRAIAKAIRER